MSLRTDFAQMPVHTFLTLRIVLVIFQVIFGRPAFAADSPVLLRFGDHPGYGRVVFDIPNGGAIVVERSDESIKIALQTKIAIPSSRLPRNIARIEQTTEGVVITPVTGRRYLRSIVNGHLVIDVIDGPIPIVSPAPSKSSPRVPPAKLTSGNSDELPSPTGSAGPVTSPRAPPEGAVPRSKPPEKESQTISPLPEDPTQLAPVVKGRTELSSQNAPDLITKLPVQSLLAVANDNGLEAGLGHRTLVPFGATVGAAAFRRGGEAIVVFDERRPIDLQKLTGDVVFAQASIQLLPSATVLRFVLGAPYELRLEHQKAGWLVTAIGGDAVASALRPISIEKEGDVIILNAELPGMVVSVPDPTTGGVLQVGTQRASGQGIAVTRNTPEFVFLPTWQGAVMEPLSDSIALRAALGGFVLTGGREDTALLVSSPAGSMLAQADASQMSRIFDFPALNADALLQRLQGSIVAAAETPEAARGPARQMVAQNMIALGLGAEAQSVLALAGTEDARTDAAATGAALKAVASLLAGRFSDADQLDHATPGGSDEISFWRAVKTALRSSDSAAAADVFATTMPLLLSYPSELQQRYLPLAAETMALGGQLAAARRVTDARPADGSLDLARAFLEQRAADPHRAADMFHKLAASPDRLVRFRAARAGAEFDLSAGTTDAAHTADTLEKLLYAWRGDDREIDLRLRIAQLRGEAHQWRPALQLLRETAQLWPERNEALKARLAGTFAASIAETAREGVKPFELVAMAEENVDLMPDGEAGQLLAERVADALIELDLPGRAIPYLEKITSKAPAGIARASFGGRLAQMRLEQGDASGALAALRSTVADSLPPTLLEARTLAFASSAARTGDVPSAINALTQLDTSTGDLRQADLAEEARLWPEVETALSRLIEREVPKSGKLTEIQCAMLLRLAAAASEAGDAVILGQLRDRDPSMLPPGQTAELLQLILTRPLNSVGDLPRASRELAAARSASPTSPAVSSR